MTTPILLAAARLRLVDLGDRDGALEAAAVRLEQVAEACHPERDSLVNPAKQLALEIGGSLPMLWGAGPTGGVAALRMSCQLAENAKYPSVHGALPETHHNQVVALDGTFAAASAEADLFRDRVEGGDDPLRLRLFLVHDDDGSDAAAQRVRISEQTAQTRSVPVTRITSAGSGPVERLASMVGVIDYASVYLALLQGIDPSPVAAIDEVKARLASD